MLLAVVVLAQYYVQQAPSPSGLFSSSVCGGGGWHSLRVIPVSFSTRSFFYQKAFKVSALVKSSSEAKHPIICFDPKLSPILIFYVFFPGWCGFFYGSIHRVSPPSCLQKYFGDSRVCLIVLSSKSGPPPPLSGSEKHKVLTRGPPPSERDHQPEHPDGERSTLLCPRCRPGSGDRRW